MPGSTKMPHRDELESAAEKPPRESDAVEVAAVPESERAASLDAPVRERPSGPQGARVEANVILIAHPESRRLGTRYRVAPGAALEIGRSGAVAISLPEVMSLSRRHARLRFTAPLVTLEDLGSTNGTYVNGRMIEGRTVLRSGDRFQTAAVHFKFLHEKDVESAYHEAIYDLMARDGLTEVWNKRKYDEEVRREFARAVRHGRPLALVLLDLDEFQRVNDAHGHLCGDFLLEQVAGLAREMTRPEQVLARVGGDEFAILSPETALQGAATLAAKLHDRIRGLDYHYGGARIAISCSCGVAELAAGMIGPESLYEAADRALRRAKREGRDRVAVADSA
ncbi:MAG TPA: GGDEF domain-containing protein [Thermoanaerobaculia bacterium]|nr:GGDEF domain-containing protein [Thermoanaerobaculia bacterium]